MSSPTEGLQPYLSFSVPKLGAGGWGDFTRLSYATTFEGAAYEGHAWVPGLLKVFVVGWGQSAFLPY